MTPKIANAIEQLRRDTDAQVHLIEDRGVEAIVVLIPDSDEEVIIGDWRRICTPSLLLLVDSILPDVPPSPPKLKLVS